MTDDFSLTALDVRAAQAWDEAAMERLFHRYVPRVTRLVAARMGGPWQGLGLADDIVQETFLDAVAAIREFPGLMRIHPKSRAAGEAAVVVRG